MLRPLALCKSLRKPLRSALCKVPCEPPCELPCKAPCKALCKPLRKVLRALLLPALIALPSACSNIDCPLDSVVVATVGLYDADTHASVTLTDTLTVAAAGSVDTVLLNRAEGISSFTLPLRQGADADTLLLRFSAASGAQRTDTLFLTHTNTPHFETIDCPSTVFHTLTGARFSRATSTLAPLSIDSVSIVRSTVNYDDIENIRLFLRPSAR